MHNRLAFFSVYLPLLFTLLSAPLHASDLEKEQRLKEQVSDYVVYGDSLFLNTGSHKFLSIYMDAAVQPAKGTVILLHGRGLHPNWPKVIFPLRTGLPEKGWNTLSIQLPVLSNEASFYDYLDILLEAHPRIEAAIHYLKQHHKNNIILLAHSCGVHMAFDWLHQNPYANIQAYIGIGMSSTDRGQPMLIPFALEDIKIPVLDIFGGNDHHSVQSNAARRLMRIQQAGHPKSKQKKVDGADHFFTDHNKILLTEISNWLMTL